MLRKNTGDLSVKGQFISWFYDAVLQCQVTCGRIIVNEARGWKLHIERYFSKTQLQSTSNLKFAHEHLKFHARNSQQELQLNMWCARIFQTDCIKCLPSIIQLCATTYCQVDLLWLYGKRHCYDMLHFCATDDQMCLCWVTSVTAEDQ
jgi:hypothetical protein